MKGVFLDVPKPIMCVHPFFLAGHPDYPKVYGFDPYQLLENNPDRLIDYLTMIRPICEPWFKDLVQDIEEEYVPYFSTFYRLFPPS